MKLKPILVAAAILLVQAGCRKSAPNAGAPIPPSGFVNRSLASTIETAGLPADPPPGPVTVPGDHRSIARVVYVGKMRAIPEAHRDAIRFAEKKTGTVPLADDVKVELLIREGGVDYWMPVGEKTVPGFKSLKPGQTIDLYATFVAAVKPASGPLEPVFVAQEYLEPEAT